MTLKTLKPHQRPREGHSLQHKYKRKKTPKPVGQGGLNHRNDGPLREGDTGGLRLTGSLPPFLVKVNVPGRGVSY